MLLPGINRVHEVVFLHRGLLRAGQIDGGRVVDNNINAAEMLHGALDRFLDEKKIIIDAVMRIRIS